MLRLNPRLPLVWRTPTSCQFGSLVPVAVLHELTPNDERALAVLHEGALLSTLRALASHWHMSDIELDHLLSLLTPALEESKQDEAPLRVLIEGSSDGQGEIFEVLSDDFLVSHAQQASSATSALDPDIVVIVADFVAPLATAGFWLRRDIPHLIVTNHEDGVRIGPLVVPGVSPCTYCLDTQHSQSDECWSAIATQLMFARAPRPSTTLRYRVASEIHGVIQRWQSDQEILRARIHVASRPTTSVNPSRAVPFSDECQCQSLKENVTANATPRANQKTKPTTSSVAHPHE